MNVSKAKWLHSLCPCVNKKTLGYHKGEQPIGCSFFLFFISWCVIQEDKVPTLSMLSARFRGSNPLHTTNVIVNKRSKCLPSQGSPVMVRGFESHLWYNYFKELSWSWSFKSSILFNQISGFPYDIVLLLNYLGFP